MTRPKNIQQSELNLQQSLRLPYGQPHCNSACPASTATGDVAAFSILLLNGVLLLLRERRCNMWAVGPSSLSPNQSEARFGLARSPSPTEGKPRAPLPPPPPLPRAFRAVLGAGSTTSYSQPPPPQAAIGRPSPGRNFFFCSFPREPPSCRRLAESLCVQAGRLQPALLARPSRPLLWRQRLVFRWGRYGQ